MTGKYYILSSRTPGQWYKTGEGIAASSETVYVGQTPDCQLRLPNTGQWVDERIAAIRPDPSREGWILVPLSDFEPIKVSGSEVSLIHYLKDGDHISFGADEHEWIFEIREDRSGRASNGVTPVAASFSWKLLAVLLAVPLLLSIGIVAYLAHNAHLDRLTEHLLIDARSSVCQLTVDSVYYVRNSADSPEILRRFSYVEASGTEESGTAFWTQDSLLVTARHCIEPWLNDAAVSTYPFHPDSLSIPARWALEAETHRQMNGDAATYSVVSIIKLSDGTRMLSSDFHYDASRDAILELGDYAQTWYWRDITARYSRQDMILGDVAWAKARRSGSIVLGDEDFLSKTVKAGTQLIFMGYPGFQVRGLSRTEGDVNLDYVAGSVISHGGDLAHGYSGGPSLMVAGGKVIAVGVISLVDSNGNGRKYSVPSTEINNRETR